METPILFIIFNRQETSLKVFESIKTIKPKSLYIASDGPRNNILNEKEIVLSLRDKIIKKINWECNVSTRFLNTNIGMKKAVPGAIKWLFEKEEKGIILEDDCLPDPSFFIFCEEMLEKYKDNEKIMHISGNFFQNKPIGSADYYFSKIPHIWGWATWKRAWEKYDITMTNYSEFLKSKKIENYFKNERCSTAWKHLFDQVYYEKSQTWDFQWTYILFKNDGLAITPNKNLVTNIGFGEMAENCKDEKNKFANLKTEDLLFPLKHSEKIIPDINADIFTTKDHFNFHLLKYLLVKIGLFNSAQNIYRKIKKNR